MNHLFHHLSNAIRSRKEAKQYFTDTISYRAMPVRYMCRYHLYIKEGDYDFMDLFKHPKSAEQLSQTIKQSRTQCEELFNMGVYDSREHYDSIRMYFRKLDFYATHHPGLLRIVLLRWQLKFPFRHALPSYRVNP